MGLKDSHMIFDSTAPWFVERFLLQISKNCSTQEGRKKDARRIRSPITGTVKDLSILQFDHEAYVDQAPGWYRFADEAKCKRMTEANIMAMYGPSAD